YLPTTVFIIFLSHSPSTSVPTTLSLHDALPILGYQRLGIIAESGTQGSQFARTFQRRSEQHGAEITRFVEQNFAASGYDLTGVSDRKSTRLNSSHVSISYAVFCLKKKRKIKCKQ